MKGSLRMRISSSLRRHKLEQKGRNIFCNELLNYFRKYSLPPSPQFKEMLIPLPFRGSILAIKPKHHQRGIIHWKGMYSQKLTSRYFDEIHFDHFFPQCHLEWILQQNSQLLFCNHAQCWVHSETESDDFLAPKNKPFTLISIHNWIPYFSLQF